MTLQTRVRDAFFSILLVDFKHLSDDNLLKEDTNSKNRHVFTVVYLTV